MRRFVHTLKRPVAEGVLRRWKKLQAPILLQIEHGKGHRFWQTGGGYARKVSGRDELHQKIQYIHNNPVKRGLAATAIDYPWSSARWYEKTGDAKLECHSLSP